MKKIKTFFRTYISPVTNETRTLKFIEHAPYIGQGIFKGIEDLTLMTRWEDESGAMVQIPDNAWSTFEIKYIDRKEY